jgi:hypothetical protein
VAPAEPATAPHNPFDEDAQAAGAAPAAAAGPGEVQAREDDDTTIPEAVRAKVEAWVPDLVKKAFAAGMGAVFTTEEGIRRITKEMPLPKDVAGYLVNTASSTKDDLMRAVAREVREFLQTVNLSEEIAKMLTTLSFEVKTEIRFIPNDQKYAGVEPDVKAKVRVKRAEPRASRPARRRMFRRRPPAATEPDPADE